MLSASTIIADPIELKLETSYSATDYSDDYVNGTLSEDDGWGGSHVEEEMDGPKTFLPDPDDPNGLLINPSMMQYLQSKFTMGSDLWTIGNENIHDSHFNASGSRSGSGELLAVIHPGSGSNTHAVILESFSNGAYSYYDAQNNCYSTISANRVAFAVEIMGSK